MLSPLENRNKNSSCCNTVGKFTLSFSHTKYGQSYNLHKKSELYCFSNLIIFCVERYDWLLTKLFLKLQIVIITVDDVLLVQVDLKLIIEFQTFDFWYCILSTYLHYTFYDIRNAPLCSASILSLRSKQKFSRLQTF